MQNSVWPTAITIIGSVLGSIIVAAVTFFLNRKQEIEADWRKRKLEHYAGLLSAISDLAIDNYDAEAGLKIAQIFNTIGLVAPPYVIDAFTVFIDGTKSGISKEEHDLLLSHFIVAIRKDIGILPKDDPKTFAFRFMGPPGQIKSSLKN